MLLPDPGTLTTLVRLFSRLPDGASRADARLLNQATTPFDAPLKIRRGYCAVADRH
jgi:hypothetical protein